MDESFDRLLFGERCINSPRLRKPVFFLHIPKTAGSTLRNILQRTFPVRHTYETKPKLDDFGLGILEKMSAVEKNRIRLVAGHMSFGIHEKFRNHYGYFTFLRAPHERSISDYYFVKSQPKTHYLYNQANSLSLEDYLKYRASINRDNVHTRIISGLWDSVPFDPDNIDMLNTAIKNLETYFFAIGLTSRFDESLLILKQKLQLRSICYRPQNVTFRRTRAESVSESLSDTLDYYNRLDNILFEHGVTLFEKQLDAFEGSLSETVHEFQHINQKYGALIQAFWRFGNRLDRLIG